MNIYQLKITLKDIRPPVWRRLQVSADIKLGKLHRVIQDAFGWTDSHLHAFTVAGETYGVPDPDFPGETRSERNVRLDSLVDAGDRLMYEYDFGDGWRHEILIEKVLPAEAGARYPRCLAGARACPPEDYGGPPGYEHMLEVLREPRHPERPDTLEWLGVEFDPEAFDLDEVNAVLRKIR